jgi:predicted nuclease of predicted toxin-antitoxin system
MMDAHVRGAITRGLRRRGVDVLTAQSDGSDELSDAELMDRATALGRVLFSQDADLLIEASRRQQAAEFFSGLVYAHQLRITVGQAIAELELIAHASELSDFENRVEYIPL